MQDIILTPKTSSQKAENVQAFKVVCKVCGYYDLFSVEPKEWACKVCEARKQKKNPDGTIRLSSVTKLSTCPKGHKQLVRHWSEPCEKCVLIQAEKKIRIKMGLVKGSRFLQDQQKTQKAEAKINQFLANKRLEAAKLDQDYKLAMIKLAKSLEPKEGNNVTEKKTAI